MGHMASAFGTFSASFEMNVLNSLGLDNDLRLNITLLMPSLTELLLLFNSWLRQFAENLTLWRFICHSIHTLLCNAHLTLKV